MFRFPVVHSLPSAIRLDEAIVPDTFWSFAESSVEQVAATHPNTTLSAIPTTLRLVVMLSSGIGVSAASITPILDAVRARIALEMRENTARAGAGTAGICSSSSYFSLGRQDANTE